MKGIILAGGTGSRLAPMTNVTNKHLLPVYDRPMIMYPLSMLVEAGIKEVMIVAGKGHAGHFLELLGSGTDLGIKLSYAVQEKPGGIAQALAYTEDFAEGGSVAVVLGDNIFEERLDLAGFSQGARLHLKEVDDAQRFGVATLQGDKVMKIVEKPECPETRYAVTGLYLYDTQVYGFVRALCQSSRGELEITDVNNRYLEKGQIEARVIGGFWTDAGTVESLYRASTLVRELRNGRREN